MTATPTEQADAFIERFSRFQSTFEARAWRKKHEAEITALRECSVPEYVRVMEHYWPAVTRLLNKDKAERSS